MIQAEILALDYMLFTFLLEFAEWLTKAHSLNLNGSVLAQTLAL
jgi:hypothetical protein